MTWETRDQLIRRYERTAGVKEPKRQFICICEHSKAQHWGKGCQMWFCICPVYREVKPRE